MEEMITAYGTVAFEALVQEVLFEGRFMLAFGGLFAAIAGILLCSAKMKWSGDGAVCGYIGAAACGAFGLPIIVFGIRHLVNPIAYAIRSITGG